MYPYKPLFTAVLSLCCRRESEPPRLRGLTCVTPRLAACSRPCVSSLSLVSLTNACFLCRCCLIAGFRCSFILFPSPVPPVLPQTTKRHRRRATTVALLDSTVKVFHDDSLKFFLSLYGHKLPVMSMDISDDGALLATGSADKTVKIWGLDFGDCHRSLLAHDDSIMVSFAILCRCCAILAIPWTGFR